MKFIVNGLEYCIKGDLKTFTIYEVDIYEDATYYLSERIESGREREEEDEDELSYKLLFCPYLLFPLSKRLGYIYSRSETSLTLMNT